LSPISIFPQSLLVGPVIPGTYYMRAWWSVSGSTTTPQAGTDLQGSLAGQVTIPKYGMAAGLVLTLI